MMPPLYFVAVAAFLDTMLVCAVSPIVVVLIALVLGWVGGMVFKESP